MNLDIIDGVNKVGVKHPIQALTSTQTQAPSDIDTIAGLYLDRDEIRKMRVLYRDRAFIVRAHVTCSFPTVSISRHLSSHLNAQLFKQGYMEPGMSVTVMLHDDRQVVRNVRFLRFIEVMILLPETTLDLSLRHDELKSLLKRVLRTSNIFQSGTISIRRPRFRKPRKITEKTLPVPSSYIAISPSCDPLEKRIIEAFLQRPPATQRPSYPRKLMGLIMDDTIWGSFLLARMMALHPISEIIGMERRTCFLTFRVRKTPCLASDYGMARNNDTMNKTYAIHYEKVCRSVEDIVRRCIYGHARRRRNPAEEPAFLLAFDVEGTRKEDVSGDFEIPHVHGLIYLPRVLEGLMDEDERQALLKAIASEIENLPEVSGQVFLEPYVACGKGLTWLATYAVKGHRSDAVMMNSEVEIRYFPLDNLRQGGDLFNAVIEDAEERQRWFVDFEDRIFQERRVWSLFGRNARRPRAGQKAHGNLDESRSSRSSSMSVSGIFPDVQ